MSARSAPGAVEKSAEKVIVAAGELQSVGPVQASAADVTTSNLDIVSLASPLHRHDPVLRRHRPVPRRLLRIRRGEVAFTKGKRSTGPFAAPRVLRSAADA
jgi:hypothetical protein